MELDQSGELFWDNPQLIEYMGICVLSLAHGSELRRTWGTIQQKSSSSLLPRKGTVNNWAGTPTLWRCPSSISSADRGVTQATRNPEDGLGEAVLTRDMPTLCMFSSLDRCQNRFLWAHKNLLFVSVFEAKEKSIYSILRLIKYVNDNTNTNDDDDDNSNNNKYKYIFRALNPSMSNQPEAQNAAHVQLKLSKLHIQLKPSKQRN